MILSKKIILVTVGKDNRKIRSYPKQQKMQAHESRRGHSSFFSLYSPDDLGDQFLHVDLELNDIRRQMFLKTICALVP